MACPCGHFHGGVHDVDLFFYAEANRKLMDTDTKGVPQGSPETLSKISLGSPRGSTLSKIWRFVGTKIASKIEFLENMQQFSSQCS